MSDALTTQEDFEAQGGLDCEYAWKFFGGTTVDQALSLYSATPFGYNDEFADMGPRAFRYYFAVLDRYVREVAFDESSELESLLTYAIGHHFDGHQDMRGMHLPVLSLCDFVEAKLERYPLDDNDRAPVGERWRQLRRQVAEHALRPSGSKPGSAVE